MKDAVIIRVTEANRKKIKSLAKKKKVTMFAALGEVIKQGIKVVNS